MTSHNLKPQHNVQVPVQVLLNNNLDANSVRVFCYMKLRFQFFQSIGKDFCESLDHIAQTLCTSKSTLLRAIRSLEKEGFVERVFNHNKTNIFIVRDCLLHRKEQEPDTSGYPF